MMKKLVLMLMLVLGLASAANAAIIGVSLQVAGPYPTVNTIPVQGDYRDATDVTLTQGQYLWIGVYNPTQGSQTVGGQKDVLLLGTVEPSPDTSWTGNYHMYVPPLVPGCPANEYYGVSDFGGGHVLDVWSLVLTDGNPSTFNGVGVLDAKEIHCDIAPSTDVIQLWDGNLTSVLDSVTIHQTAVPEPTTIALLGLGGLLLRRRK